MQRMDCQNCDTCKFTEEQKEIYYETHITVAYDPRFVDYCKSIGVKVVHIDMGDDVPKHLMTSHTTKGDDYEFLKEAHRLTSLFFTEGFDIQRVKVETVPWHPYVDEFGYFECHLAYKEPFADKIADVFKLHKSRNLMKTGDSTVQMYTYREYNTTREDFEANIECTIQPIQFLTGMLPEKRIIEYAIYDSNKHLDDEWMKVKTQ